MAQSSRHLGCEYIDPGTKILSFPHEIACLKDRSRPPAVLNVELDLTNSCNAHCKGCDFPDHSADFMDAETLDAAIATMTRWGTKAVVLTGGGEPTVHPQFAQCVKRLAEHFKLGLYTNGIRPCWVEVADRFAWVFVSIDAADAQSWARYKMVDQSRFQAVRQNIAGARNRTVVGAGFLIGEDNYRDAPRMAQLGAEIGAAYSRLRPRWPFTSTGWRNKALSSLRLAEKHGGSVDWAKFEDLWAWERSYETCWASMFIRSIGSTGEIYVCPTTRFKRTLGHVTSAAVLDAPVAVNGACREGCRGHAMNLTLEQIMRPRQHGEFV